jgi:hypothetical protein
LNGAGNLSEFGKESVGETEDGLSAPFFQASDSLVHVNGEGFSSLSLSSFDNDVVSQDSSRKGHLDSLGILSQISVSASVSDGVEVGFVSEVRSNGKHSLTSYVSEKMSHSHLEGSSNGKGGEYRIAETPEGQIVVLRFVCIGMLGLVGCVFLAHSISRELVSHAVRYEIFFDETDESFSTEFDGDSG